MLFCLKIKGYAVLSQKLFCSNLRTFYVETNKAQNFVRGENMTNIMYGTGVKRAAIFIVKIVMTQIMMMKMVIPSNMEGGLEWKSHPITHIHRENYDDDSDTNYDDDVYPAKYHHDEFPPWDYAGDDQSGFLSIL